MRGSKWDLSDGTKPCPACGEAKPLSEFGTNKYSASGLSVYCKACAAAKARAYRATPEGKRRHYESTLKWVAGLPDADIAAGVKVCPKCQVKKPFSDYPKNARNKHGIGTYCLVCSAEMVRKRRATPEGGEAHRASSRRWRVANIERVKDNNARWNYGLDPGGYDKLLAQQEGKCAICKTTEPGAGLTRFHIDHCHSSDQVRGLLCEHCNRGLGHFKDDPSLIRDAANYMERFNQT